MSKPALAAAERTPAAPSVAMLRLSAIRESPLNPRRTYDASKMFELVESVRQKGVLQPVLVRVRGEGKLTEGYELVYGHRRFRAARSAGLETLPAIVREMSDREVLEAQVIENSQREDVPPLEEAEGFETLRSRFAYPVAEIAAKVGKSEAYVYQRLKLRELPGVGRKALERGELAVSVGLAIARIGDPKLREAAAREVCSPVEEWEYEDGKQRRVERPRTSAEALQLIRQKYALRFEDCGFSLEDPDLVAGAGACSSCPKRTKNSPMLFPDMERQDRCSDPACFAAKKAASIERRRAAAEAAGRRVLTGKESKAVFIPGYPGDIASRSPYIDPSAKCYEDPKRRTYQQLLGKDMPEKVLAIDPESATARELVDRKEVERRLKKVRPELGRPRARDDGGEAKRRREAQIKVKAARLAIEKVVAAAEEDDSHAQSFWDVFTAALIGATWNDVQRAVALRRGLDVKGPDYGRALKRLAAGMPVSQLRALAFELLVTREAEPRYSRGYGEDLVLACALYGVDLKALERELAAKEAGE